MSLDRDVDRLARAIDQTQAIGCFALMSLSSGLTAWPWFLLALLCLFGPKGWRS